jgi:hypothetical protein
MNVKRIVRHSALTVTALIALLLAGATLIAARGSRRLTPAPLFTTLGVSNATQSDPIYHGINETAVVVQPFFNKNLRRNVDNGIVAYMRYQTGNFIPTVRVATTTSFATPWSLAPALDLSEFHAGQQISYFSQSGDPALAANPSDAPTTFHSRRVYVAARMWTANNEDQIGVWYTDGNPTSAWSIYPGINYNDRQSGNNFLNDKPAIVVSRNAQTSGMVYLAFVRSTSPDNPDIPLEIQLWRLGHPNDPVDTWTKASTPVIGTTSPRQVPQTPRLEVDPATGTLYLAWLDWGTNNLAFMVSPGPTGRGGAGTWLGPFSTPTGTLNGPSGTVCRPGGGSCFIAAASFLFTSFNSADSTVAVAYHRRKAGTTNDAEVVMRRFSFNPGAGTGSFTGEHVVSDSSSHNQWHPAVACDANGTCLVTYYDYSPADAGYRVYGRKVAADGTPLETEQLLFGTTGYSEPARFDSSRIEYPSIFYNNGTWYPAFLWGSASTGEMQSDVYVARAQ